MAAVEPVAVLLSQLGVLELFTRGYRGSYIQVNSAYHPVQIEPRYPDLVCYRVDYDTPNIPPY